MLRYELFQQQEYGNSDVHPQHWSLLDLRYPTLPKVSVFLAGAELQPYLTKPPQLKEWPWNVVSKSTDQN